MNRIRTLLPLIVAAIFQTTPVVHAQQIGYVATVPFQFSVDNKIMPAGTYRVTHQGAFLHIENQKHAVGAIILLATLDPSRNGHDALVFDEINGRFFLRRLNAPSGGNSMQMAVSREEKHAIALARATPQPLPEPAQVILATGAQ